MQPTSFLRGLHKASTADWQDATVASIHAADECGNEPALYGSLGECTGSLGRVDQPEAAPANVLLEAPIGMAGASELTARL